MTSIFKKFLGSTAIAIAVLVPVSALAEAVQLKFATIEPPTTPVSQMFQQWIDEVNTASNGALEIELFPGGALGRDPRAQLELVQNGVTDIAFGFPFLTPNKFPNDLVTTLPLVIRNASEGTYAHWKLYEREMLSGWDDVVPLLLCTPAPTNVMSVEDVPTIASLEGLRGSATNPLAQDILKALGAVPVSGFNFATAAEAMSRGQLDFDLVGFTPASIFKQSEVAISALEIPLGASPCAVFMNREAYDGLPEEARAVLDAHRGLHFGQMWAETVERVEAAKREEFAATEGKSVYTPSEADLAKAEEVTGPLVQAWIEANADGSALVEALKAEVQTFRETGWK
ncbi:C4-dicarboxylate ABC transporter [Sulfitobacter porphyrae]|nr:C4-dicarboxylate ABC transporter [Sulfitobacter porphyrae]